jgi:hypothetical protein
MTTDRWLKRLAPGTLLYNKNKPERGFFLVVQTTVKEFPGNWTELFVLTITPECTLKELEVESGIFTGNWAIVDVE